MSPQIRKGDSPEPSGPAQVASLLEATPASFLENEAEPHLPRKAAGVCLRVCPFLPF